MTRLLDVEKIWRDAGNTMNHLSNVLLSMSMAWAVWVFNVYNNINNSPNSRADFSANLEKSFTELDEVVQSLATGEIADSVREIASFRTKIKDIGSKVFEMDAEVEEMTRDRRNNILVHGLPVQEGERM